MDNYGYMNRTELLQILATERYGYLRLRKSVPVERLAHLIRTGERPTNDEIALTSDSRFKLQTWVDKNRVQIESQLPCTGLNRGKCTIYPCSEGKHLDCFLAAQKHWI